MMRFLLLLCLLFGLVCGSSVFEFKTKELLVRKVSKFEQQTHKRDVTQFVDGFWAAVAETVEHDLLAKLIGACENSVISLVNNAETEVQDVINGETWESALDDFANTLSSALGSFQSCGGDTSSPWFIVLRVAVDSYKIYSKGKEILQDLQNGNDFNAGKATFYLLEDIGGLKLDPSQTKKSVYGERMVPSEWICPNQTYNTSDGCDCNCGAYDPDCDDDGQKLIGCSQGLNPTCDSNGKCSYSIEIPSKWWCDPSKYNSGDGCHCNCGIYDPDCDKKNQFSHNCPCGSMTCHNELGTCVGECKLHGVQVQKLSKSNEKVSSSSSALVASPFLMLSALFLYFF